MAVQKRQHPPDVLAQIRGAQNRAAGEYFEKMIGAACEYYRLRGVADIDKTPEPTKQLSKPDKYGRFTACYEKKAQPDFKGTLEGGRSVVFEAKFTSTGQMKQSVVLEQQEESLNRHARLGAFCFVLIGFSANDVYRVPWDVWRTMKERYGRKYLKPEDIPEYKVKMNKGILDFLSRFSI